MSLTTAWLLNAFNVKTMSDALFMAILIGIGYAMSVSVVNAINPKIARPLLYGAITGSYHTVSLLLITITLFLMK